MMYNICTYTLDCKITYLIVIYTHKLYSSKKILVTGRMKIKISCNTSIKDMKKYSWIQIDQSKVV